MCERVKTLVDALLAHHFPGGMPRNGFPTKGGEADQIDTMFPRGADGERNFSLITDIVFQVGASLGFVCKVERVSENFTMRPETNILAKYFNKPVPYLGYEHYYDWEKNVVVSCVDLARWLAQAQFPKRRFDPIKQAHEDEQYFLIRATTLALNTGLMPLFAREKQYEVLDNLSTRLDNYCRDHKERAMETLRDGDEEFSLITPLQLRSVEACRRQLDMWEEMLFYLWEDRPSAGKRQFVTVGAEENVGFMEFVPTDEVPLPRVPRVVVQWKPVDNNPRTIPVRSWRAVGRTQPRPLQLTSEVVEPKSELATARGRRREHGRAGQQYLQDRMLEFTIDDEFLPSGRRGGQGRPGREEF